MRSLRFYICLILILVAKVQVCLADCAKPSQQLPDGSCVTYPPQPGVNITLAPSLWYGFTDRTGPLFKNSAAQPVGIQTSRFGGPIGGFTVTVDPQWSSGWLANTSFNFSAYYAKEHGSFSAVYYKTVTNDENNNWQGTGNENSQDYEALVLKELLPEYASAGSSSASMMVLGGVRYINLDTAIVGQDLFQNQLTYNRHNTFYLGEGGLRFVAPLGGGWRLMLGGTGLYGTTYDQNGEVCGCGNVERDTRSTRAYGYDFYGGISIIPHEMNSEIPEGISLTLKYRDRSLFTNEQGVVGINHQVGPQLTFAWKFPDSQGE